MAKLKLGDKAPEFNLLDQNGNSVKLSDYIGKKVLVYFYPKADTSGCAKQACSIRDAEPDLSQAGVEAIGISPDKPDKQKKFDDKYNLGFPLLSDSDHVVAGLYGAWGEKKMYGKTYMGILRSTYVIDENGLIARAFPNVKPDGHAQEVLAAL